MHPVTFHCVHYLLSVGELSQLPPDRGAEVAFAGRSNAGKSSAINALCGRRGIAFVSRTPGRTQLINFFRLGAGQYLVDLPGYGYANAPLALRARWEALIGAYLQQRRALRGLILVMDARHPLTPLDRRMLDWFASTRRPVHALLSKADKLSRQAGERQRVETQEMLSRLYPTTSVQLFSSTAHIGLEQARGALATMLEPRDGTEDHVQDATPDGGRIGP
jgi:GTP-binding protein